MPLDERNRALLLDMLQSARKALSYTKGKARSDLDGDEMLADAVVRRIEIVGEAARGVSEAFQLETPHIAWRAIIATRHILAHDYDAVNHDVVWRIVTEHLPILVEQLIPLLGADADA